ncbi:MAG: addiction module toxin, HicA family [Candidatus Aquicultor secundus]|uniref:Addiction module toxin, HicA family n=1 Tax=Candidatus Aquicultor secundus TaxID=1973895 RepID=A0A2M7T8N9_9ACTN|nr:type II toxin-antitoxin system HicA family toxin [Candidatus Aquicultor secundus]NCO66456.1 type II toxin-antitoxin system HicA family toxin [Solirubrobacter sp.]OIO83143.1 MAG: addiction module toxin, HicA family [Candidatus Aquicultor secundus]PIU27622.1 MAG: addiction module toxin, HicA family [Candidatus Aquicultor secundus]PIW22819.1 MAG: addiction module toxin, HicA family [Candidatus Aquicultor secundus]PIX52358.1 MAG: addiction module toxin, HicA family [Candidatus Aquicultor secund
MKSYKAKEVVSILKRDGWYLTKTTGSHHHFKHPTKPGKVTVPYRTESEDIKIATLKSILKQAMIDLKEV